MVLEQEIAKLLKKKNLSLAVAESCTGGLLSHVITNVVGSSEYFDSSVVCYSKKSKIKLLGVPEQVIDTFGTVSAECAITMAKAVKRLRGTKIGLAVTGIAGADLIENKPVGMVYIALSYGRKNYVERYRFKGKREEIKKQAAVAALELLWSTLGKCYHLRRHVEP